MDARTEGHPGSLLQRLVAGCAIVAVTAGVPAVLAVVGGNPFAAHLAGDIVRLPELVVRRAPVQPSEVVAWVIAVCVAAAWLVWAWMCTCLVVEARARRRGLPAARLPAARTLQSVAAVLVGSVLALGALSRPGQQGGGSSATSRGVLHKATPDAVVVPLASRGRVVTRPGGSADGAAVVGRSGAARSGPEGPGAPELRVLDDFPAWYVGGATPNLRPVAEDPWAQVGRAGNRGGRLGDRSAHPPGHDRQPDVHPAGHARQPEDRGAPQRSSERVHVVGRRETLWSIADRQLGSSLRWPELASLNYGVLQPDGGVLGADHWVRPGWRLRLPGVPGSPSSPPGREATGAVIARGPTAGAPASPTPASPTPDVLELGTAVGLGAGLSALTERLRRAQWRRRRSGQLPRLAGGPAAALERQLRSGARVDDVRDVMRAVGLARASLGASTGAPAHLGHVVAVRVSADEVAVLVRSAEAPGDTRPSLPEPFQPLPEPGWWAAPRPALRRTTETCDVDIADSPPLALVTVAVSAASAALVDLLAVGPTYVGGAPEVVDAQLRSFVVELAAAPSGPSARVVVAGLDLVPSGLPGVDVAADAGCVLTELDASIGGPPRRGPEGTSDRTSDDEPALRTFTPLLVVCGSRCQRSDVERLVRRVQLVGAGTTVVAAEPGPDRAGPVLVPEEPARSGDGHGARRARVGDPASFVSPNAFPPPQEVDVAGGSATGVTPYSGPVPWAARPAGLATETAAALESLVSAARGDMVAADAEPYRALTVPLPRWYEPTAGPATTGARGTSPEPRDRAGGSPEPAATRAASARPAVDPTSAGSSSGLVAPIPQVAGTTVGAAGTTVATTVGTQVAGSASEPASLEVEVLVLGPVEIRGAARPFTRAWACELVVYLAMHERGATTDTWAAALWPDRTLASSSLHSTASVARRALGVASDGLDHLPKSQGRLQLRSTVGTDWARFVGLADEEDPDAWTEALGLVRGRPFEGLRAPDWPLLEGIAPAIEASVVDLAGRCSAAALRRGDARASSWAARRGLQVSPYDERLYRMLMRAADLAGNVAGVEAVMAELLTLVADDVEPCDSVHPATIDLYRQLSRRSRLPRAASGA